MPADQCSEPPPAGAVLRMPGPTPLRVAARQLGVEIAQHQQNAGSGKRFGLQSLEKGVRTSEKKLVLAFSHRF
jgi:hypothetical protein